MKTLVIAEKPSVARDIARVLKCESKAEGYIYNDKYIITWAVGHLVSLCEPEEYDIKLKIWNINTLPIIPNQIKLKPIAKTKQQLKIISSLINKKEVDSLICATDSGREGELIFRYIYEITKCKKPFKRLWISSMTDEAISEGFKNLKDSKEYDNLYLSAKCRSEADWLVGINASRVFTLKFDELLSIGRVQTPTLSILVTRQEEIENFKPEPYFELEAKFLPCDFEETYKGIYIDKDKNSKIFVKQTIEDIINKIKDKDGVVENIENKNKELLPPLLYDLTELQRDCNKKFSYSAQKTLSIAQDLYEKRKLITYPRTDSRYLSKDMSSKLRKVLEKLNDTEEFKSYASYVLSLEKLPVTKRIIDDKKVTDHHAIIPTISNIKLNNLSQEEKNVFTLIARRFLAVFYPKYIYQSTKIITKVDEYNFLTKGITVIQKGFTELNFKGKDEKEKKEAKLPRVSKGDIVKLENLEILEKKTTPPPYYDEASLLSAMENAGRFVEDENIKESLKDGGLGTPATRASIIERLISIGYVTRDKKSLIPTQKGKNLIKIVPKELKSPETTGKWEKGLVSISKGDMNPDRFMTSINRYVNFLVDFAKNSDIDIKFEKSDIISKKNKKPTNVEIIAKCPKCGSDILENSKAYYCSSWKQGCKFTLWKNSIEKYGLFINKDMAKKLIENKRLDNIKSKINNTEKIISCSLLENGSIKID